MILADEEIATPVTKHLPTCSLPHSTHSTHVRAYALIAPQLEQDPCTEHPPAPLTNLVCSPTYLRTYLLTR